MSLLQDLRIYRLAETLMPNQIPNGGKEVKIIADRSFKTIAALKKPVLSNQDGNSGHIP